MNETCYIKYGNIDQSILFMTGFHTDLIVLDLKHLASILTACLVICFYVSSLSHRALRVCKDHLGNMRRKLT